MIMMMMIVRNINGSVYDSVIVRSRCTCCA